MDGMDSCGYRLPQIIKDRITEIDIQYNLSLLDAIEKGKSTLGLRPIEARCSTGNTDLKAAVDPKYACREDICK